MIADSSNSNQFNIIKCHEFLPRKDSLEVQYKSDLLLFLEWNDISNKGVIPAKLFEYLVSGRPIIGVGSVNNTVAGEIIESTGTGLCFIDEKKLSKCIRKIFEEKLITFYHPNKREIEKYSRLKQAQKIIELES